MHTLLINAPAATFFDSSVREITSSKTPWNIDARLIFLIPLKPHNKNQLILMMDWLFRDLRSRPALVVYGL